jgi:cytochrome c biogenesis factor
MTRIIGLTATCIALIVALYGMVVAVIAARRRMPRLAESARAAVFATFGLMTMANLAMIYGLVTHDFSIAYPRRPAS